MENFMRSCKLLFILINFLVAKDVTYKIHNSATQDQQNLITLNGAVDNGDPIYTIIREPHVMIHLPFGYKILKVTFLTGSRKKVGS